MSPHYVKLHAAQPREKKQKNGIRYIDLYIFLFFFAFFLHGKKKLRGYALSSLGVLRLTRLRTDCLGHNGGKRSS